MIRLNPRRILAVLLTIDLMLLLAYLAAEAVPLPWRVRTLLDMNRDLSVPAWWSAAQLLVAGLLGLAYGFALRGRDVASHWKIFVAGGAGLVLLSADEAAMIHETISAAIYQGLSQRWALFAKATRWDALTAALYAAAGLLVFVPFRRDLWPALRERGTRAAIAGAALFAIGAVFLDNLPLGAGTALMYGLEDMLELAGGSVILYAMLRMLEGRLVVHVGSPAPQPRPVAMVASDRRVASRVAA